MSDIVQDLLRQLKGGKTDFTKRHVNDAITVYQSYMCEIESLRDLCGYQDTNNASDNIKKELEQLRAENSTLSKELDFYIRVCKDKDKNESKSEMECKALKTELTQMKDDLIKTKQELEDSKNVIENFQCQYEKQRIQNLLENNQLEQLKTDNRRLKVQFDKLTKNHEAAIKDLNHYKARSTCLEQELEKLRLDYKNELDRYTNREKLGRKMHEGAEYKNEEHYQHKEQAQPKAIEKLRHENTQLKEDKLKISEQINELKNRLSVLAAHKLTDGNPAIAELSDPFRPTNIAAQFRQLYDDVWTCALEELEEMFEREEEIFDFLACIIKDIDRFCIRARSQQLEHPKYFAKSVIQDPEHQPEAKEEKEKKILIFRQVSKSIKDKIGPKPPKGLEDFLEKAFELIWVMKMQDPAMEFVWSKPGDNFDNNMYTHYTKRGSKVTQCIWPAIVHHRAGPLMSKGVVQEN